MDYFKMWYQDKECILNTMVRNMAADLAAGYNYFGNCIQRQQKEIAAYKEAFDRQIMAFADMEVSKVSRWCYYDLLRRGAISL